MLSRFIDMFAPRNEESEVHREDRVKVATCVLLLEVAHADDGFSSDERAHVAEALRRRFSLSDEEIHELIEAADEARRDSHDLWRFTNRINEICAPAERREIIREVWRVVYADDELGSHEDHLIHRMASLLNLTHPQLIEEKMIVLKERREGSGA